VPSLADNDDHVLRAIAKGNASHLLVSLYGDADTPANKEIVKKAEKACPAARPDQGQAPISPGDLL
jgi:hypothetical protein